MAVALVKHVRARLYRLIRPQLDQLEFRLDHAAWQGTPVVPGGFRLEVLERNREQQILALLHRAGFAQFRDDMLRQALHLCVPQGCLGVIDEASGTLSAMMMARHMSDDAHPLGGRIDWLAADPTYVGRGLGLVVAGAATNRLLQIGYRCIWVTTDDHRVAAVRIFLKLGFRPVVGSNATRQRWNNVLTAAGWTDGHGLGRETSD